MARYAYRKTYTWTADLAYIVGLIASDGSLSKDGRHISFTSKDRQLAELFRMLIKPSAKLAKKSDGRTASKNYFLVQFSDVALYDFLVKLGMTPNKSLSIPGLDIPLEYFADFLRGEFDGDGSVHGYQDMRWRSSYMYYTSFVSGSYAFLSWIRLTIAASIPDVSLGSLRPGTRCYQLFYAKKDSRLLFRFMYYKECLPHLHRKHARYLELFATSPYA